MLTKRVRGRLSVQLACVGLLTFTACGAVEVPTGSTRL